MRAFLIGVLVLLAMAAWAQPDPDVPGGVEPGMPGMGQEMPLEQLVGMADLIVVGTVQTAADLEMPSPFGYNAAATVTVAQTLKGNAPKTLTLYYMAPRGGEDAQFFLTLKTGQQAVFLLQRIQRAWTPVAGKAGVRAAAQADAVAKAVKAQPLTVTIEELPALYFGYFANVTVTVTNTGDQPLTVQQPYLEGMFLAPDLGMYLPLQTPQMGIAVPFMMRGHAAGGGVAVAIGGGEDLPVELPVPAPQTLAPGASHTFPVKVAGMRPEAWKVLQPDTYFVSPAIVRASCYFEIGKADPALGLGRTITSAWVQTLAGYRMPDEDGTLPKPDLAENGMLLFPARPMPLPMPIDLPAPIAVPFDGPVQLLPGAAPALPDVPAPVARPRPAEAVDGRAVERAH